MKLTPKRKVAMPIGTRASKADQRGRLVIEAMRRAPKPQAWNDHRPVDGVHQGRIDVPVSVDQDYFTRGVEACRRPVTTRVGRPASGRAA